MKHDTQDKVIKGIFFSIAFVSIAFLLLILFFLIHEGIPIFQKVGIRDFLFGRFWYPTADPPDFGIFPLIAGSFFVTVVSALISVPLGIMTAIYLAEIASPGIREAVKPLMELLASIPSVVVGFFGMVLVAPFLQDFFDIATGLNLFNASLMLAFMSIPTICTISEDAICAVPGELKEASLALGANHLETIFKVILPASLPGVSTAVILGMSRAIGETMVVLMVSGGAAIIPESLFDPVRPMPAAIAAEMAEAPFRSDHYHALFAIGLVLLAFNFVFNSIADYVSYKHRQTGTATL